MAQELHNQLKNDANQTHKLHVLVRMWSSSSSSVKHGGGTLEHKNIMLLISAIWI